MVCPKNGDNERTRDEIWKNIMQCQESMQFRGMWWELCWVPLMAEQEQIKRLQKVIGPFIYLRTKEEYYLYLLRKSSVCFKKTLEKDTKCGTECQDWLLGKNGYARKGKKYE